MAANVQDAIMLLGDSLTQGGYENNGFASKLAHVYNRKMDVINRGFSGYNTDWMIPVLEQVFATQHEQQHLPKVRLLVIWLGANDAVLPGCLQHVPLDRFRTNLAKLIWMVSSTESQWYSAATRIVLMTPPPVHNFVEHTFENTRTYAQAVMEVAGKEGVVAVDVWTSLWEKAGRVEDELSKFLADGLHLNEAGYAVVFDELMKTVAESYPKLYHDNLRSVFIPWNEVCEDLPNYRKLLQKRSAFPDEQKVKQ